VGDSIENYSSKSAAQLGTVSGDTVESTGSSTRKRFPSPVTLLLPDSGCDKTSIMVPMAAQEALAAL